MNTEFTLFDRQLTLIRYPAKHQHKSLQAWDSADELVIEHLLTEQCVPDAQPWIIMNDDFGSLATFFADQNATTAVPTWVSDSTIARLSLAENLQVNHCKQVDVVDCLASLPTAPAL
ncbi:MAG: 23S rRNA (guanine(1835)-N(2))-methyltransferase, partial [Pseudomonadota bacterium]|nr:23S rRNA (guanine(1835)-N(2))-methyltransferase [Pseudomonadota bacterium]